MFKALPDRMQPIGEWVNKWTKGEVNLCLPILFERGCSYSKLAVDREVARELYRELILLEKWEILNCFADFINEEKGTSESLVSRELLSKSLSTLGYRRCTYDKSEDWKEFTERNLNKKAFGVHLPLFEYAKESVFVGENERKLGKARALYFKGKIASKDKKREKLFLKSALLGYLPAYSELAFTYEGMGNDSECLKWHSEGAKLGLQDSCIYLANLHAGTEKEYEYLYNCYQNRTTYPSTLLRFAGLVESQLCSKNLKLTANDRAEKEAILYDVLARIIYENTEIESDKCEEINTARITLARLILENKIKGDGVLAIVLIELALHAKVKVEQSLISLMEKYRQDELQALRRRITRKMNDSMQLFKHEENERAERDKPFREIRQESARLEREEKERKENERKEKALKEFVAEAKADADRYREEKRLGWARPLDLGVVAEYTKLKGESEAQHKKAVNLYQEALDSHGEEDTLNALLLAGEAGHPHAIWELAKYFHTYDEEWALHWLEKCAEQGNLNRAITAKWKWTIGYVLQYFGAKHVDIRLRAEEALGKITIKSMTSEEQAGLKALADSGNKTAIKVYANYIKYKNPAEWAEYTYAGANAGDPESIEAIVRKEGEVNMNSSDRYLALLKNPKAKENDYVTFQWYKIYSSEELAKKCGVNADSKKAFGILEKLVAKKPKGELKKQASLELAKCYEYGIGTNVALYFASKYYRGYDDAKADLLLKRYEEREERERRERKAIKLMEQYPSTALSNLQKTNPTWANNIIVKYKTTAPEKLEENLKARDEYLRFGFSIADMYEFDGTFKEYQMRGAYLRKKAEQEERAKKEAEERARIKRIEEENARLIAEQERIKAEQARALASQKTATASQPTAPTVSAKNTAKSVSKATKKQQEQEAIAKVRAKYGYVENGKYSEQMEYFYKICSTEDTCGKAWKIKNDPEALGEFYGVPPERVISKYDFAFLLKQKIEKVVGCCPEVEPKTTLHGIDYYKYAERDLAGLPCYGGALGMEVSFIQDIRYNNITTAPTSMDLFYDEYQKFHADEISKFVDFDEYARKSGLNYSVYSLEREEVSNGKSAARKITRAIAKELLKHYVVTEYVAFGERKGFKKYYYGTLFVPTSVEVTFNFWGND